ncbi:MAG: N-acetylglucosamine-6-phosphate deacetylase [Kiritimatiellae bacterium]|nr:N-acetylglucosamine-6-phosphate deacetylase [Kiritimatiellia bacterium]
MKTEGWIDLQINGYAGVDFNAPGLSVEAVKAVTKRLAEDGTVGYMPTLVTGDPEMLMGTIRAIAAARKRYAECERAILGFFLEGPFISPEPGAVGTHPVEWVRPPDLALFGRFQDAAEGLVRMVNVAAEVQGAQEFVRAISAQGVVASLGHQMATSPAQLEPCLAAGAKAFTHLGNGIPNEVNRHDNIIFTALVEDRASIMFIPDGHHLPDTMLKLYCRAVPLKRLIAVSDAQYPAGMPPGEYEVCGAHARLEPNGLLWNPARNCLVGATTPMAKMMKLLQDRIGLTESECRTIGRDNPLALIGLR